jgi:hypothetical protein
MKISKTSVFRKSFWRSFGKGIRGFQTHRKLGYNRGVRMKVWHRGVVGTMYNEVLRDIGARRNPEAYKLLLTFSDYILAIDPILDNPSFGPRKSKQIRLQDIKSLAVSKERATKFVELLKASNIPDERKKRAVKVFANFRRNATKGVQKTFSNPFASYSEVKKGVDMTAGEMFSTFAELAYVFHGVPERRVRKVKEAYRATSNSLQFVDDMKDCLKDFGNQQNLLISIARPNKKEFDFLMHESNGRREVSLGWIKKNLPNSFAIVEREFLLALESIPDYAHRAELMQFAKDAFYGF